MQSPLGVKPENGARVPVPTNGKGVKFEWGYLSARPSKYDLDIADNSTGYWIPTHSTTIHDKKNPLNTEYEWKRSTFQAGQVYQFYVTVYNDCGDRAVTSFTHSFMLV